MAAMELASFDQVPDIIEVLKADGQDSLSPCQMLQRHAECKRVVPDLDARLYLPGGKVDEFGMFFLYIPEHRGNALFHTLDTDYERVVSQFRTIPRVDWDAGLCIGPVHDKFLPLADILMAKENLENWSPNPCKNYGMPREDGLKIPNRPIPYGLELRPLTVDDAEFVNDRWPHKEHHTLAYIRNILEMSDGVVLCNKETNEKLSWCMHSIVGGIGMIKTADEHRGKGYAEIVAAAMTKQVARAGFDPQVQVRLPLVASHGLFQKVGYKFTGLCHWMYLRRIQKDKKN